MSMWRVCNPNVFQIMAVTVLIPSAHRCSHVGCGSLGITTFTCSGTLTGSLPSGSAGSAWPTWRGLYPGVRVKPASPGEAELEAGALLAAAAVLLSPAGHAMYTFVTACVQTRSACVRANKVAVLCSQLISRLANRDTCQYSTVGLAILWTSQTGARAKRLLNTASCYNRAVTAHLSAARRAAAQPPAAAGGPFPHPPHSPQPPAGPPHHRCRPGTLPTPAS